MAGFFGKSRGKTPTAVTCFAHGHPVPLTAAPTADPVTSPRTNLPVPPGRRGQCPYRPPDLKEGSVRHRTATMFSVPPPRAAVLGTLGRSVRKPRTPSSSRAHPPNLTAPTRAMRPRAGRPDLSRPPFIGPVDLSAPASSRLTPLLRQQGHTPGAADCGLVPLPPDPIPVYKPRPPVARSTHFRLPLSFNCPAPDRLDARSSLNRPYPCHPAPVWLPLRFSPVRPRRLVSLGGDAGCLGQHRAPDRCSLVNSALVPPGAEIRPAEATHLSHRARSSGFWPRTADTRAHPAAAELFRAVAVSHRRSRLRPIRDLTSRPVTLSPSAIGFRVRYFTKIQRHVFRGCGGSVYGRLRRAAGPRSRFGGGLAVAPRNPSEQMYQVGSRLGSFVSCSGTWFGALELPSSLSVAVSWPRAHGTEAMDTETPAEALLRLYIRKHRGRVQCLALTTTSCAARVPTPSPLQGRADPHRQQP